MLKHIAGKKWLTIPTLVSVMLKDIEAKTCSKEKLLRIAMLVFDLHVLVI